METLVFVYGTLLSNCTNHFRHLAGVPLVAHARTAARYTMISLGGFPAILEDGETAIIGELYAVDDARLLGLDRLEGHPSFYERKAVEIDGYPDAVAYFLPKHRASAGPVITSGSWKAHCADAAIESATLRDDEEDAAADGLED